jgi:hypothetical protein
MTNREVDFFMDNKEPQVVLMANKKFTHHSLNGLQSRWHGGDQSHATGWRLHLPSIDRGRTGCGRVGTAGRSGCGGGGDEWKNRVPRAAATSGRMGFRVGQLNMKFHGWLEYGCQRMRPGMRWQQICPLDTCALSLFSKFL